MGRASRDTGQSRVPEPPASNTGTIMVMHRHYSKNHCYSGMLRLAAELNFQTGASNHALRLTDHECAANKPSCRTSARLSRVNDSFGSCAPWRIVERSEAVYGLYYLLNRFVRWRPSSNTEEWLKQYGNLKDEELSH